MSSSSGPDRPSADRDDAISPLRFLSGGVEFAVTCVAAALAGRWLDDRLGTEPWLTAGLLIVAFASATWVLLRSLTRAGNGSGPTDGSRSS
jgi:F0F1-type ATP synthase assembly protein I